MKYLRYGIVIYFVIASLAMWFLPIFNDSRGLVNYVFMSFTGLAAVTGIFSLKTIGTKGERGCALLLSVIAAMAWFLGELLWTIDYIRTGIVPFPSLGDLFFLTGYILYLVSLIREIRVADLSFRKINRRIITISSLASFFAISSFALFTSALTYSGAVSLWENIVTIGYGLGDVILITIAFFLTQLVWVYRGGKLGAIWRFLLIGFIFIALADFLYGIYFDDYEKGLKPVTNIIDIFYMAGYGAIAIHYLKFSEVIKKIQQKAQ